MSLYQLFIKRVFDFIITLLALVSLFPLFLIITILIKLDSKGPILFKQKRVGLNESVFDIYKFRSMRVDAPKEIPTHLLDNPEVWITSFGKVLRKTSIDELPQLFNIILGQMSLVGPRPALWNQFDLIDARRDRNIHSILPGLTGWAQVNGRDELSLDEKVELDAEYLEKMSFWFDVKCLLLTVKKVIKREGVVEGKVRV